MSCAGSQEFVRAALEEAGLNDALMDALEARVVALEEIAAARGVGRLRASSRLRQALRASVRHVAGHSFTQRRFEATATEWALPRSSAITGD